MEPPVKKRLSAVWQYFTEDENDQKVTCIRCNRNLTFKHHNTSGMIKHLNSVHNIKLGNGAENFQQSDASSSTVPQQVQIDEALVKMIYKDLQPISIVEDEGFKEFCHILNSNYKIPNRKKVKNLMQNFYNTKKQHLKEILSSVETVSITTDFWSSINADSFLGVTYHYIDSDYNLRSSFLTAKKFIDRHTTLNVASALDEIFCDWGIEEKVTHVVTDGARNMVSAVQSLRRKVQHVPCCAHILNLICKDSLNSVAEIVDIREKCRKIVSYFKNSIQASIQLREIQESMKKPIHKLTLEVETRWNSTYEMFLRLVEQKECVVAALTLTQNDLHCLTNNEFQILNLLVTTLEPLAEMTTELSTEKYVSLSKVLPLRNNLIEVLNSMRFEDNIAEQFRKNVLKNIHLRMGQLDCNIFVGMASLVDPRFKTIPFSSQMKIDEIKNKLVSECSLQLNTTTGSTEIDANQENIDYSQSKNMLWRKHDDRVNQINNKRNTKIGAVTEVNSYLANHYLKREDNPVEYWSKNYPKYPAIASVAKKYLSIPATSVPSERLFSLTGNIITKKRRRLNDNTVNNIVFLNSNFSL